MRNACFSKPIKYPAKGRYTGPILVRSRFAWETMRKQEIQLQNSDGSHCRWLCQAEADRLEKSKEAHRISKRKASRQIYRFHAVAQASESRDSSPQITPSDVKALVGLYKVDETWVERLIGFKLLREGTLVPQSGYL